MSTHICGAAHFTKKTFSYIFNLALSHMFDGIKDKTKFLKATQNAIFNHMDLLRITKHFYL